MATEAYKSLAPEDKAAAFNLASNAVFFIGGIIALIIMLIAFGSVMTFVVVILGFVAYGGYMYLMIRPGSVDSLKSYQKAYTDTVTPA